MKYREYKMFQKPLLTASNVLEECLDHFFLRSMDILRITRIASILQINKEYLKNTIIALQQKDGGWSNVEESIWCLRLLKNYKMQSDILINAIEWLKMMQHRDGGWGISDRDRSRIPTTALALTLIPELGNKKAMSWLADEWGKDLNSEVQLTYKGAFYLMAQAKQKGIFLNYDLVKNTMSYLTVQQNDDGGFGPWKDHPIGSDPWSTGITLVGLTAWPDILNRKVVLNAVEWLCSSQLESGLWPYHFIDEGSVYAYWGLKEALVFLEEPNS